MRKENNLKIGIKKDDVYTEYDDNDWQDIDKDTLGYPKKEAKEKLLYKIYNKYTDKYLGTANQNDFEKEGSWLQVKVEKAEG